MVRWCLVGLMVLAACGGGNSSNAGPTDPDPDFTPGELMVMLTGGDGQTAVVTDELPEAVVVTVTRGGEPEPRKVVNFVVTTDGGGRAFAGSSATDEQGRAADRWILGEDAGVHAMEVRTVDSDGTPRVWGTFTATAEPDAADRMVWAPGLAEKFAGPQNMRFAYDTLLRLDRSIELGSLTLNVWDQYDNEISDPSVTYSATAPLAIADDALTANAETVGSVEARVGSVVDTLRVHALRDLNEYASLTFDFTCYDGQVSDGRGDQAIALDSLYSSYTDLTWVLGPNAAQEYVAEASGSARAFLPDGSEQQWDALLVMRFNHTARELEWSPNDELLIRIGPGQYTVDAADYGPSGIPGICRRVAAGPADWDGYLSNFNGRSEAELQFLE